VRRFFLALVGAAAAAVGVSSQSPTPLEVLPLRANVFLIAGAGGNIVVQSGEDGVVVVDAGAAGRADAVMAAITRVAPAPIRYVINTSADADHVGGNEAVSKAGQGLLFPRSVALPETFLGSAASILAAEKVLTRMSAAADVPTAAWPTETFDYRRKYMYMNGEGIEVLHQPAAHSDGDSIVFFRRSDVIAAGDIIDIDRFPVIDVARGGTIEGEVAALNRIVELAIPSVPIVSREAGTLVVPGHGRILDQLDVVAYRDMVTIVRDRVRDLRNAGLSLEQVKAARPARGYTREFGEASAAAFVEAVYRTLPGGPPS
jgi:glyoxylase-like metal-dependent hydrolase (beta-lactamase superfamily II)